MLNVVMRSVIMLNVVMLNVLMLSVVAPYKLVRWSLIHFNPSLTFVCSSGTNTSTFTKRAESYSSVYAGNTNWSHGQTFGQDEPWAEFSTLEVAACLVMHFLHSTAIQPNLELKTHPKQLLGYLSLVIALPAEAHYSWPPH